jgi:triacylglycerol esterase/lipase EstA (alpha/beta hydrolase family)
LRKAIEDAVHELDPQGKDPALRQIVLIGHSQGGLLAKMLVIDSGSRLWDALSNKPLDELSVSPETRALLRRAAFVAPVPEVRRVIFIATPQHGSFIAGAKIGQLFAAPRQPAGGYSDGPRRIGRRQLGRRKGAPQLGRIWQRLVDDAR